jgi:DNA-binding CsgD family transcriptional regulator
MLKMFKWGMSDEDAHEYYTRWAAKDPWASNNDLSAHPPGTVTCSAAVCPDEILEANEVYQCFLKERNLHYGGAAVLDLSERICTAFGTLRAKQSGKLTPEELDRIRRMAPHLQRVVRFQDRLDELETERGLLRDIFDQTGVGIVLLDKSGAVITENSRAAAILRRGGPIRVDQGQLRAPETGDDRALQQAIRHSVDRFDSSHFDGQPGGDVLSLWGRLDGNSAQPMRVLIVPAEPAQVLTPSSRTTAAIVHIIDPAAAPRLDRPTLRRVFSLSKTEAEVASHLASGLSAAEVAEQLHVSLHTVRSHLKKLFQKTGTTQQSALVSLILRFQTRLPGAPPEEQRPS